MARKKQQSSSNKSLYVMIAAVIVVAAIIFMLSRQPQPETVACATDSYNHFDFDANQDGGWFVHLTVNSKPYRVLMHHHPCELENISVQENAISTVMSFINNYHGGRASQAYITVHPEAPGALVIAGVEIAKIIGEKQEIYGLPTSSALTKNSSLPNTPTITCDDADLDTLVLWIKEEGDNIIIMPKRNCIVLQASTANETIMVADRFVYELFGVMPKP